MLGLVVAVGPSIPVLLGYLPARLARARDAAALRRALTVAGDDPRLHAMLAHRAATKLPYRRLLRVTDQPWRHLESGRHEPLAAKELRRLGLPTRLLGSSPELAPPASSAPGTER